MYSILNDNNDMRHVDGHSLLLSTKIKDILGDLLARQETKFTSHASCTDHFRLIINHRLSCSLQHELHKVNGCHCILGRLQPSKALSSRTTQMVNVECAIKVIMQFYLTNVQYNPTVQVNSQLDLLLIFIILMIFMSGNYNQPSS